MKRLFIFALAFLTVACEDSVDPTVGVDAPFSLYGYLDPTADRQAIRIAPIIDRLGDSTLVFAATVTSTDLETGATVAWRDSLVTYPSGATAHVFVADGTPRPGSTVRIEAAAPDGTASTVDVDVPPIVQAEVGLQGTTPGEVTYPVRFRGAPRVLNGQLRLTVVGVPGEPETAARTLRIPLAVQPVEVEPDVWEVTVPFLTATRSYLTSEGLLGRGVRLVVADYVGFVTGDSWALPTTDVDVLVEPGVFSNVNGGLGFVGGGYFATARWTPPPSVQRAAGFEADGDPAAAVSINEVMTGANGWVEFYNPQFSTVSLSGYSVSNSGLTPRLQTFPFEVQVPPQGFAVVALEFRLGPGEAIGLYDRTSTLVSRLPTATTASVPGGTSFGSFPDGATFQLPQGGPNIFRGPLLPTPGAPNELGIEVAAINELFTEGSGGFVEAVALGWRASGLLLMSDPGGFFQAVAADGAEPYVVARETPGGLDLVQIAGTVYLLASYDEPRLVEPTTDPDDRHGFVRTLRVVDVRRFGGQTPGRAEGYLPDTALGTWTPGLRPTPGAPNAAARLGL